MMWIKVAHSFSIFLQFSGNLLFWNHLGLFTKGRGGIYNGSEKKSSTLLYRKVLLSQDLNPFPFKDVKDKHDVVARKDPDTDNSYKVGLLIALVIL